MKMQYVLYQRKIQLRTRSMRHLLSSVDPVLYCDTNGQLMHRLFFYRLFHRLLQCLFLRLAIADCALPCLSSQSGAFIVCVLDTAVALLFASFIMLDSVF